MHLPTKRKSPVPLAGRTGLGEHLEETVRRFDTTDKAVGQSIVSVADHGTAQTVFRVACLAVALCAGRRPEEVAVEVASRVIHNLRAKLPTEAAQREVER